MRASESRQCQTYVGYLASSPYAEAINIFAFLLSYSTRYFLSGKCSKLRSFCCQVIVTCDESLLSRKQVSAMWQSKWIPWAFLCTEIFFYLLNCFLYKSIWVFALFTSDYPPSIVGEWASLSVGLLSSTAADSPQNYYFLYVKVTNKILVLWCLISMQLSYLLHWHTF